MNMNFLITLGLAFLSFVVPVVCYSVMARKSNFNRKASLTNTAFLPLFAVLLPLMLLAYFFLYNGNDFIGSFNLWQIIIPFAGALMISAVGVYPRLERWFPLILILAVALSAAVIPDSALRFIPALEPWTNRIIIAAAGLLFAGIYRYANSGDGMLASQSLTVSSGIGILGTLNAAPFLLGIFGWMYTGAFAALLAFSWHPSRIKISRYDATACGLILFALTAPMAGEGAASCCIILSLFFLIDFAWALLLELTFLPRYDDLYANTSFQQAVAEGMNPAQAASFSMRIQLLMLFFGCFQAYSPTPWSLLLVSSLIALWLIYRFRNIPAPMQSFKDINAQVLEELQDRVNEFKNYVKKDDQF